MNMNPEQINMPSPAEIFGVNPERLGGPMFNEIAEIAVLDVVSSEEKNG